MPGLAGPAPSLGGVSPIRTKPPSHTPSLDNGGRSRFLNVPAGSRICDFVSLEQFHRLDKRVDPAIHPMVAGKHQDVKATFEIPLNHLRVVVHRDFSDSNVNPLIETSHSSNKNVWAITSISDFPDSSTINKPLNCPILHSQPAHLLRTAERRRCLQASGPHVSRLA